MTARAWRGCRSISPAMGLRDLLSREIKSSELLRALIVVGPFVAAYFISRETAFLNRGGPDRHRLAACGAERWFAALASDQSLVSQAPWPAMIMRYRRKPLALPSRTRKGQLA